MSDPKPETETTRPAEFDETSTEASLRRIAEETRNRKQAYLLMIEARSEYKVAKEAWKKACEDADAVIESEVTELPLFPRARERPGKPTVNRDEPGATWLSALDGMPSGAVVKLGEKGIQTVGELGEFTGKGGKLTDVEGIGPAIAEKVINALDAFWKAQGKGAA